MPGFKMVTEIVPVSAEFIESRMADANGAYVKVYLYALMLASRGESAELSRIAGALRLLESDVKNALDYWVAQGLFASDGDSFEAVPLTAPSGVRRKSGAQVSRIMSEDAQLKELCALAEAFLGKPLSVKDMETLYWMCDELGFSPEAVSMVLEYCADKDKRSVAYAEKVAVTWSERGINTIDAIEKYIREEKERTSYFYSLRRLFGIADRPLSKKEEEYLKKWSGEFKMSEDMVALAYEYCIMQTNKLSFPYMDTILSKWNAKDIHTIADAEKEHARFRSGGAAFDEYRSDVDYSELERLMREKYDG